MTDYIENHKLSTEKFIESVNEYSRITRFKISTQKLNVFLYTNNKCVETRIKDIILFAIMPKRTCIHLNKTHVTKIC